MPQYYSTFPVGFEPAVEEFIQKDMPGTQMLRMLEGAVEYKRRAALREFPKWFHNSFLCLMTFPRSPKEALQDMVRLALQRGVDSDTIFEHLPQGASTFRAMFMLEGELAHAGVKTMEKTEQFLQTASGLMPGRARPDVEFWFVYRREGIGFLLMRLTPHRESDEPEAGELRADLAHLLCRLSNPRPEDAFLDPFAGYGGVVKARLAYPAASVTAGDLSLKPQLLSAVREAPNAKAIRMDALDMSGIPSGSMDVIVCDPPWGEYKPLPDASGFYARFAVEARRVLRRDGRVVMLTALKQEAEAALKANFSIEGRLDVLVSGRKAGVFLCRN